MKDMRPISQRRLPKKLTMVSMVAMAISIGAHDEAMAVCLSVSTDTVINSNGTSCINWSNANLTVTGTGILSGAGTIVSMVSGTGGTLSNSGTIAGSGIAIANSGGSISAISNDGLIQGASAITNQSGTIGSLVNNGFISAAGGYVINNNATIGTLVNNNQISSNYLGIYNGNSIASLTNNGSGTIHGNSYGVYNSGTIGQLTNSGAITSGQSALVADSGTIGTLNNSGTISAPVAVLIQNGAASIGQIINSGVIAGAVYNASGSALNINGGSGTIYGTLTGGNGGVGSADIGTITNAGSNINFGSGNLLLNDNIVASGRTVNNTGATLQVNNRITITGTYQQSAAATLAIGVAAGAHSAGVSGDTGYGRLVVTGNTVIDSGSHVTLKALGYSFAAGQRFLVIQTSGTANYNAATLNYAATGFTGTVTGSVDTSGGFNSLVLSLSSGGSGGASSSSRSNFATNANAISALNGLYSYGGVNAQLLSVFNPALALNDTASANRAGAQLNPAAMQQAAARGTDAANNAVLNVTSSHLDGLRLAQSGASGVSTGERSLDPAMWGQFFGGGATQDERDGVSGYHSSYRGLLIGGDLQTTESWRTGGLFSYARTNVGNDGNNSGSSASINSYGLTAYAGYDGKPWYLNVMAGLAQQQYSTVRPISFTGFNGVANGSFNGLQSTASVQAGYPLALANEMTLTPLAGMTYSKLRQNGYTETGGSGAALTVQAATATSLKSDIGARLERKLDTSYGGLKPSAQLRWRHEFQDSRLNTAASFAADPSGATSFTTAGASPVRNTGVIVLGATLQRSGNLSLSANYTLEAGRGYHSQTGDVRLRWQY